MTSSRPILTIRSIRSDRQLTIQLGSDGTFDVALTGHPVQAAMRAWVQMDLKAFVGFFDELGRLERPWSGERKWGSVEGDLVISVTCSSLGAVVFRVALFVMQSTSESWQLELGIETEFGQLANLAASAREVAGSD